jgi:hypothetical protein
MHEGGLAVRKTSGRSFRPILPWPKDNRLGLDIVRRQDLGALGAGILDAAIRSRLPRFGCRPAIAIASAAIAKFRSHMRVLGPADHTSAKWRWVGDPELIEAAQDHAAGKIGNEAVMSGVRRRWGKRDLTQALEIILPHQSQYPLVISLQAFALQESGDPPVAVVAMLNCQALNGIAQPSLFLTWRRQLPVSIVPGATDAGELAHSLDPDIALRAKRHHRLEMAVADAPRATITTRSSNRRTNSSRTKMAPTIGALNAVARPAPAPAASNTLQSGQPRRNSLPIRCAMAAAIWTLGPSRPSASPEPIASTPATNFTGMIRNGACGSSSFRTASTCGMPLPDA